MPSSFLPDVAVGHLLLRTGATAIVVVGVTLAVGRFGPTVGGALAGLPIVLGPGFFFLARQASPDFTADAAVYSLLSLCATQTYLLAYIGCARRGRLQALSAALAAWGVAALILRAFPAQLALALVLFILVTCVARTFAGPFVAPASIPGHRHTGGTLLLRGLLAGVLVAVVTTAASRLGASASGLLLAFPVGYTVLSTTLHERFGTVTVTAALHSAILGTMSLGGFCAALASLLAVLSPIPALLAASAVAVVVTTTLVLVSALRRAPEAVRR